MHGPVQKMNIFFRIYFFKKDDNEKIFMVYIFCSNAIRDISVSVNE